MKIEILKRDNAFHILVNERCVESFDQEYEAQALKEQLEMLCEDFVNAIINGL